jgi:Ca2+-binding RTX toxin-like protein
LRLLGTSLTSLSAMKAAMTQVGSDVVLKIDSTETLTFRNTVIGSFTENNFQLPLDRAQLGTQTFSEEFNSLNLFDYSTKTGLWKPRYDWGGIYNYTIPSNGEKQIYVAPGFQGTSDHDLGLNPFSLSNGVLTIRAEKASSTVKPDIWNYDYTSGVLTTRGTFQQQYGYFEIRADVPDGWGYWPAFWLSPLNGSKAELDVLESLGRDPHVNYAFTHDWVTGNHTTSTTFTPDPSGFHTYGMLWTPSGISFYLDGLKTFSAPTTDGLKTPMYMVLNLAVGGYWADFPNGSTPFPGEFKIDYVKAWALSGATPPPSPPPPPPSGGVTLTGTEGADTLKGGTGNDTLNGLGGNDYLTGLGGADTMTGGLGDDHYVVDNAGDRTVEQAGQGGDTVDSTITWTLQANTEYLNLLGTAAINGTGTDAGNVLRGNDAANTLSGLGGNDVIDGKGGNDRVDGGAGDDTLTGGAGADVFVTGQGRDVVLDYVDGTDKIAVVGWSAWTSLTQQGADTVVTFSSGDSVVLKNVQASTVTSADFQFGGSQSPPPPPPPPPSGGVTLTGTDAADTLKGGSGNDTLSGLGGNDYLNGAAGADAMTGGAGNDYFVVDNAGDTTVEQAGGGQDSVEAWITWALAANTEYLNLGGTAAINGTGNGLDNVVRGNSAANTLSGLAGNDTLEGKGGNDTLTGGVGIDTFLFRPGSGQDRITDWQDGTDRLDFTGFGTARPTITQSGADTVVAFSTGETVTLAGVSASTVTTADMIFH